MQGAMGGVEPLLALCLLFARNGQRQSVMADGGLRVPISVCSEARRKLWGGSCAPGLNAGVMLASLLAKVAASVTSACDRVHHE